MEEHEKIDFTFGTREDSEEEHEMDILDYEIIKRKMYETPFTYVKDESKARQSAIEAATSTHPENMDELMRRAEIILQWILK